MGTWPIQNDQQFLEIVWELFSGFRKVPKQENPIMIGRERFGRKHNDALAKKGCQTDESLAQTEEEKSLQLAHRQAIQTCGDIYYPFATSQEVASQVLKLRFPERNATAARRVSNIFLTPPWVHSLKAAMLRRLTSGSDS